MDKYKHSVFFDVGIGINRALENKIRNYFNIRRTSGGGDCGSTEKVGDKCYKISFRDQKDQQRVLEKSEHVLELPGGPLVLTVRGTLDSSSPSSAPATPGLAFQSQQPFPVPALPSSGVDHELQFDTYLLHYLEEECPRAWRELKQELSSLGCSIKLHPDNGRVLIRGSAQVGLNLDQWKAQVEDQWVCHYEVDPIKSQVLLQSAAIQGHGEGVRVYSKDWEGLAVMVGGSSEVHARLTELELSEGKTGASKVGPAEFKTTLWLGEAKLSLLWETVEGDIGDLFPEMKVTHGDPGHLVLEGSAWEVGKCIEWVSHLEPLVLVVPEVSPCLLSFLRQRYGGPGELEAVLGLGCQVKIELVDTEPRVLALSSDELSKAEKALRAEFGEKVIDLPDCSIIPAELTAQLESKQVALNRDGLRVVVNFDSGCRVHLLGHVEEVDELQNDISDYLLEHATVEETVCLPVPDIARYLPDLIETLGLDRLGVTFTSSPHSPLVVLSGPSKEVTRARGILGPAVDDLVEGGGKTLQSSKGSCEDPMERQSQATDEDFRGRSATTRLDREMAAGWNAGLQGPDITEMRMILLGKTGVGKSSSANTILDSKLFTADNSPNPVTQKCETRSKLVRGRKLLLVDTPGFFAQESLVTTEEELKQGVMQCMTSCSPGPHAFIIILKVERYTAHENQAIREIEQYFSPEAFRFATVLFTHGCQLNGEPIETFVDKSEQLRDLVKRCGGRCHVIDNKHWGNEDQVEELLDTVAKMVGENGGSCYTNGMLQAVTKDIQKEEEIIRGRCSGSMSEEEITATAKDKVCNEYVNRVVEVATGAVLGALLGVAGTALKGNGVAVLLGLIKGGLEGVHVVLRSESKSETASEAAMNAATAVWKNVIKSIPYVNK